MFRSSLCRTIMILLLSLILPALVKAQTGKIETPELKNTAGDLFEKGKYQKAYETYLELLTRYPKDGMFNYYAGISLLKLKKDLPAAIEHLDRAASRSSVPNDVYLYLGQAYRENYQFRESKVSYMKYSQLAGRSEVREHLPERQANMSANAMSLTMEYNPFEVLASSLFDFNDSAYVKQVRGKGGQLTQKPGEFFGKDEIKGDLSNYMFLPKRYEKGDYVFVSGYGKPRKKGADLYRVKRVSGKSWGEPKAIDELNTEYDEIMPYFDPISKDLYFASTGHSSMGGFDVFKSHYDEERDTWSQPVNLGFPVNSPMNDYLVLPGADLGTLLIITDRQGMDSMLTVYKLHLREPKRSLATASAEELKKIGNLGGIESIPAIVDMKKENQMVRNNNQDLSPYKNREEKKVKATAVSGTGSYQAYLKAALASQVTSDSLSRLAKEARIKVKDIQDPNERWEWQKKIIEWEKYSRDYQEKANLMYAKMKEEERSKKAGKPVPSTLEKDAVINEIQVFRYADDPKENNQKEEIGDVARQAFGSSTGESKKAENMTAVSQRFAILEKSPYSINNPFPLDIVLPAGAFYRIQLGVFSQEKSWEAFGGISPVTIEKVKDKTLTRYYAGKFNRYEDASRALEKVRQAGYPDAFIVSWYNGQRISTQRVIELEKRDLGRTEGVRDLGSEGLRDLGT